MPRRRSWTLLAALVVVAGPSAARAQYVGVGVARPAGVYGSYWPGYLGAFPGGYRGFWGNGFSMYGPPVPTYGSVPGYFGGADQRLSNFNPPNIFIQNGASIGLGQSGAGGAGPRRRHWTGGGDGFAAGTPTTAQAVIDVRVPTAEAEVYFEGNETRQKGARRVFQSPPVEPGTTYFYKVRAKWKQADGTVADQERSVAVRANETAVVDFNLPPAAANAQIPVPGME